ncbi:MAG: hypothetical protein ACYTE6_05790 [Planctomycetota bacterium]|jgi:hypothetical protein
MILRATRILLAAASMAIGGCSTPDTVETQQSALTPGTVKRTIVKGETSQAECLEVFGPPDLVTHRDGMQIWTYDKTSYDYEKGGSYFTVILYGVSGDRVRSSSKSTMLILYFDDADIVQDYRLSAVKF